MNDFPRSNLARRAGEVGGTLPAVLNAANEVAVERLSNRRINFLQISELVGAGHGPRTPLWRTRTWTQILAADAWARKEAAV